MSRQTKSQTYVFDRSDGNILEVVPEPGIEKKIIMKLNQWISSQGGSTANWGESGNKGYIIAFHPGTYKFNGDKLRIPFMCSMIGLGKNPCEVVLDNCTITVPCGSEHLQCPGGGATQLFWRDVQNITLNGDFEWFTSQECPLRRIICNGDIRLDAPDALKRQIWSSGGFFGNVFIDGTLSSQVQQQFCFKNVHAKSQRVNSGFNMVFINCDIMNGVNPFCNSHQSHVEIQGEPVKEKPFMIAGGAIVLPADFATNGVNFKISKVLSDVVLINPKTPMTEVQLLCNTKSGVILTPGVYHWAEPLFLNRSDFVLLGVGWPVIYAGQNKSPILQVIGTDVCITSMLLDVGTGNPSSLIQTGKGTKLFDICCRATLEHQSSKTVMAKSMINVVKNAAYLENIWLWVADHGPVKNGTKIDWNKYNVPSGLLVSGDDVSAYGLFVEHQSGPMVSWSGENGKCIFYQSEFPYGGKSDGSPSYQIDDRVTTHVAKGLGIYAVIPTNNFTFPFAMTSPKKSGIQIESLAGVNWWNVNTLQRTLRYGTYESPLLHANETGFVCSTDNL